MDTSQIHRSELPATTLLQGSTVQPDSPILTGLIAVGLVLVDSTDERFRLTEQEKIAVVNGIAKGLDLFRQWEPRANIAWFYDIQDHSLSLGSQHFTNVSDSERENLWRNTILGEMSYSADLRGLDTYVDRMQNQFSAQWAYTIFVTKYPVVYWAYARRRHIVLNIDHLPEFNEREILGGWGMDNIHLLAAHETAHLFGCPDEYDVPGISCSCTTRHGRDQILNGNCLKCTRSPMPCLMAKLDSDICSYTRGHLGWGVCEIVASPTHQ